MSRDDVKPRPSLLMGSGLWLILNAIMIVIVLVVLAAMGVPFTSGFLHSITISWVIYATLAPAMMLVVISGGLDLSTGAVAALAGIIVLQSGLNIWIGVAGAICIALAFGFVNGFFATTTKLNGALITVGTYSLIMGVAKLLLGDEAQVNSTFRIQWVDQFIWACFLFSLAFCVVAAYILDHSGSRPGIQPHSLRQRALYIGLPFIVTGVCAGLAGMLRAERVNAVWTTTVEMPVAVVLAVLLAGGSPFARGRTGSRIVYIFGALLASLTVALVYYLTLVLAPTRDTPILLVTGFTFVFALLLHVFASYGDLVDARSDYETGSGRSLTTVSSTTLTGVALWGQGASRAEEVGQTSPQTWEYREIALGKGRDLGYVSIERQTIAAALLDFWFTWESDLRNEVSQHTTQGWEIDPTAWGPSCIKYRIRSVGMSKWGCGAWLFYIVGGIATMGIGFVLGPLLMRSRVLQPTEVVIRLRRLTAGGTRAN